MHDFKNAQQIRNRREVSQFDKKYLQNPLHLTYLNGEKLEAFPPRSGK